jgi:Helicase associated domain
MMLLLAKHIRCWGEGGKSAILRSLRYSRPHTLLLFPLGAPERRDLSSAAAQSTTYPSGTVDVRHAAWQSNFERLAQYVKEQQQTKAATATTSSSLINSAPYPRDDPSLRAWLDKQRYTLRHKKREMMTQHRRPDAEDDNSLEVSDQIQERIRKLESLGYSLSPRDENWERKFQQLQDFVNERGHFPNDCSLKDLSSPTDRSLMWWCRLQRKSYKRVAQEEECRLPAGQPDEVGNHSKPRRHALLTKERIAKLESIGFCFDPFEETWSRRYQELIAYRRHHGNCRVPSDYPANQCLAVWVGEQRYHYKKFREQRPNSMTPQRIELLNEIGFEWNVFDAQWNEKYERLREHVRMNGPGRVVSATRHDREIQNWIKQQVKLYRAKLRGETSSLTDEREEKLMALGFPWRSRVRGQ